MFSLMAQFRRYACLLPPSYVWFMLFLSLNFRFLSTHASVAIFCVEGCEGRALKARHFGGHCHTSDSLGMHVLICKRGI